jgi:flagellin-like protein
MKGITPIISIIILLLITIGLASAAWTYMSGYMTNLTSRVLDVSTSSCINGVQATVLVRNAGTNRINVTDIKGLNLDSGASLTLGWTDLGGAAVTTIEAGQSARVRITNTDGTNCTTVGTSKACKYELTLSGTTWKQELPVYCTG